MPGKNSISKCCAWGIVLGSLILGGAVPRAAAAPEEKYTIRRNVQAGFNYAFDLKQDSTMKSQATVQGQQVGQMDQKIHTRRVGTAQVLEVQNANPSVVRVTFEKGCETSLVNNGQNQSIPFPFSGQTVTIRRDASGNVTNDAPGNPDPDAAQELQVFTDPDTSFYPKGPVSVGQEWPGDAPALAAMFQLQGKDTAGLTAKLLSIKTVNGRRAAEVKVSIVCIKNGQPNSSFKQIMQGTLLVDFETGAVLQSDVKGTITSSGEGQVQSPTGQQVLQKVTGEGTSEIHGMVRILGGPVAKATVAGLAPAPIDAPPGGAPPVPPVGPYAGPGSTSGTGPTAIAPPAPPPGDGPGAAPTAASSGPFAGTYRSEKLTLNLQPVGDGYTGTVRLGDRTFPVTARESAGGLQGTFESQGAKFDFRAAMEGDDLKFTTGSSTYRLKKDVANPLDQPAAPNPLEQHGS